MQNGNLLTHSFIRFLFSSVLSLFCLLIAPVIVFNDANLEDVVSGIRAFGFYNAGQDCTAGMSTIFQSISSFYIRG